MERGDRGGSSLSEPKSPRDHRVATSWDSANSKDPFLDGIIAFYVAGSTLIRMELPGVISPSMREKLPEKGTTEKLRLKEWEKRDIFLKLIWKLVQKCLIYAWIASFRSKQIPWCA